MSLHEIATLNNYKNFITLPALEKNVHKMLTAKAGIDKNEWTLIIALNNIIEGEQFKQDFRTAENFADWIGVNKSTITKATKSVKCMVNTLKKYGYDFTDLSYSKAYRLAAVEKDMSMFIEFCSNEGVNDFRTVSVHGLEELIRLFKNGSKVVEQEQEQEQEQEKAQTFTGKYTDNEVWFKLGTTEYVIPMDLLQGYRVNV